MSETKFKVGQWVKERHRTQVWKVERVDGDALHVSETPGVSGLILASRVEPFRWEVGRTYKTTLDGVTANVLRVTETAVFATAANCSRCFDAATGVDIDSLGAPTQSEAHLLPYLADYSPQIAEAATEFSEFEDGESDELSALESLRDEFKSRHDRYALMSAEHALRADQWRKACDMVRRQIERAGK